MQTLGARPVDFSDPPGHLDRTWRNRGNSPIPWFGRTIDGHIPGFMLAKRHGKLDVGHYTATCRISDF